MDFFDKTLELRVIKDVCLFDIIEAIADSLSEDDIFDFIVELDNYLEDYEFTERLRDHFVNFLKKEN